MNAIAPNIAEPKPQPVAIKQPFHLRLWPAVVIVLILRAILDLPRLLETDNMSVLIFSFMLGPLLGFVSIAVWWLFFSRVSWREGFGMLGFGLLCGGVLYACMDRSMGMSVYSSALPMVITVGVAWLIVSMLLPWSVRRIGLMVAIVSTCFCYSLLRFDGVDGGFKAAHSPVGHARYSVHDWMDFVRQIDVIPQRCLAVVAERNRRPS